MKHRHLAAGEKTYLLVYSKEKLDSEQIHRQMILMHGVYAASKAVYSIERTEGSHAVLMVNTEALEYFLSALPFLPQTRVLQQSPFNNFFFNAGYSVHAS